MSYKLNKLSALFLGSALTVTTVFGSGALEKVMKDRGLTENDVIRAAKTYNPTGGRD